MTIHHLRRDYRFGSLVRDQLPKDPLDLFRTWFDELRSMDLPEWFEPNAMSLATAKSDGSVACRIVLLKEYNQNGFTFFTNYQSAKGDQITHQNRVALGFFWPILERQIRVEGEPLRTVLSLPASVQPTQRQCLAPIPNHSRRIHTG
jgi:pyridoxamine 5'-phosphate oxidase